MLLPNSEINDAQRVSVIASASAAGADLEANSRNDQFLDSVTYSSIASVIKQCDQSSSNRILMGNSAQAYQKLFNNYKNKYDNN